MSKHKPLSETIVLSLGAGVQSSTLALMAAEGWPGIPKPDFAVFADTQWEPPAVYEHLDWLETQLDFEVIRTTAGNIRENVITKNKLDGSKARKFFIDIPTFIRIEGVDGQSIRPRQCTANYKIKPIQRIIRQRVLEGTGRMRLTTGTPVTQLIGISTDEFMRMKDSRDAWNTNRYPLIEIGYSRRMCREWFGERYPDRELPRSACIGCPYHNNEEWAAMLKNDPESFADAVEVDELLRADPEDAPKESGVHYDKHGRLISNYLHHSAQPLQELIPMLENYEPTEIREQLAFVNWNNECEGMCGV